MTTQSFDITGDKTGTKYNIHIIAEHPLKIGTGAPDIHAIMSRFETGLMQLGMSPLTAQVERMDEPWGEYESQGWVRRMPEALLMAVGKALDGFKAQADDPDSDVDVIFDEEHPSATVLAAALLAHRKEVNSR
ncbi:hypothetical protein SEA_HAGER_80 [Microbacterium phage Hager]|nr:hypothetical protein SEA_HAGER_80 [Microbacterium phage Hager]